MFHSIYFGIIFRRHSVVPRVSKRYHIVNLTISCELGGKICQIDWTSLRAVYSQTSFLQDFSRPHRGHQFTCRARYALRFMQANQLFIGKFKFQKNQKVYINCIGKRLSSKILKGDWNCQGHFTTAFSTQLAEKICVSSSGHWSAITFY